LALFGCSARLAGMNDAELNYDVTPDPASGVAMATPLAAARVKDRLSAAQIFADVSPAEGKDALRIVVDADAAAAVDALLRWRGGLGVYRVDDAAASSPGKVDRAHASFAELRPDGSWQKRMVVLPPVVTLGMGDTAIPSITSARHGHALALYLAPAAREALAAERSAHPGETVALVRDHTVIVAQSIDSTLADPLVVDFGSEVAAYARAAGDKALLESPQLPPMRLAAVSHLAPRYGIAAACALLPFALSLGWLLFVRRFDRARPEPTWLVLATFALGGVAVLPAGLLELGCSGATPWLDPSIMTFGGQLWALPIAIVVFTLVVGVSEEGSKFLGAWVLARHRREFDEPVDGIVYGCAAALGFAAVENVKYFALGRMSWTLIAVRAFVTVPAHLFFGAIWGYAMGMQLVSKRTSVLGFLALAALLHGTFDAMLSIEQTMLVATVFVLALAVAFVAMLRSALTFGRVGPRDVLPESAEGRVTFRVGSPLAFYGCAAGIVACAITLTGLGSAFELLHHRVGSIFVALATTLLALCGIAAYGASATIPLDVAIDALGITFAGARTPWSAVVRVDVETTRGSRARVNVSTRDGIVRLGPASTCEARTIAQACAEGADRFRASAGRAGTPPPASLDGAST
ncbi:MAG: PrsW family intramembrane metalloprotease, partial [Polyangiaceae bacterium]